VAVIWEECEMCGDYICNIHEVHTAECSCPCIEVWVSDLKFPYDDEVTDESIEWVNNNPYNEEEQW
jgi:hypothetical protein